MRTEKIGGKQVILIRRFDRMDGRRIPFMSAMSMLGANDNEAHSYLEIADVLRQYGAATKDDLAQLWRRIVFNVLISNTDDHLRNHGFLYASNAGWRLSPVYDLNPVPVDIRPRVLSTAIDLDDATASIGPSTGDGRVLRAEDGGRERIAVEVAQAVSDWRSEAARLNISTREIERMASAFAHEDMEKALCLT